jgi:hypothetical protein
VNVFALCECGGQSPKNATAKVRQFMPLKEYSGGDVAIDLAPLATRLDVLWLRVWVDSPKGWGVFVALPDVPPRARPLLSIPKLSLPKLSPATDNLPARRVVLVRFAPVVGWFSF